MRYEPCDHSVHAHGVDDDEVGLLAGVGHDALERIGVEYADAAALHLVEVARRLHVPREDQTLERLDVGAGGDHVHGDHDAGVE